MRPAAIAAGCDVFVTSDLSYHQFLDAAGKGIRLIDAGHFPTEDPVCAVLVEYLQGELPRADRDQIRLPPGGHPVLRRRRVIDYVRTFQVA